MPRTKNAPQSREAMEKNERQRKREIKMNKEIIGLQSYLRNIIPKAPFCRLIKEIIGEHGTYKITAIALTALQEASEMYLTHLFSDAYLLTHHRNRVTLGVQDIQLVLHIRKPTN